MLLSHRAYVNTNLSDLQNVTVNLIVALEPDLITNEILSFH